MLFKDDANQLLYIEGFLKDLFQLTHNIIAAVYLVDDDENEEREDNISCNNFAYNNAAT